MFRVQRFTCKRLSISLEVVMLGTMTYLKCLVDVFFSKLLSIYCFKAYSTTELHSTYCKSTVTKLI